MGISGAGFTTAMTKGSARFLFYLTAVPKYMPTGLHSAAPRTEHSPDCGEGGCSFVCARPERAGVVSGW